MTDISAIEMTIFMIVFVALIGAIALLVAFTASIEGEIKEMRKQHEKIRDEHETMFDKSGE